MSLPSTNATREYTKFVESPTRPDKAAVEVFVGGGDINVTADIELASTPVITNLPLPVVNTEVSHSFQSGLKKLLIRSRGLANLKIAFVSTESATKYLTIRGGAVLSLEGLDFNGKILYIQSDKITTVEILEIN